MKYFSFILVAFFLFACSKKDEIHWDRDMCQRCKMVVSDRKNAIKLNLLNTNKYHVFDDIGCFIIWESKGIHPMIKVKNILINDSQTGEWIDMKKALYTKGNLTPMGYGFWAYKNGTQPKDKQILSYEDVKKLILSKGK